MSKGLKEMLQNQKQMPRLRKVCVWVERPRASLRLYAGRVAFFADRVDTLGAGVWGCVGGVLVMGSVRLLSERGQTKGGASVWILLFHPNVFSLLPLPPAPVP